MVPYKRDNLKEALDKIKVNKIHTMFLFQSNSWNGVKLEIKALNYWHNQEEQTRALLQIV
jgi:ABC-type hemin transport system substrate-binding protein